MPGQGSAPEGHPQPNPALALLALSAGAAAAEPPCRPSARLTGERPLADEIGAVLRERGIAIVADAAASSASAGSDSSPRLPHPVAQPHGVANTCASSR